MEKELTIAIDRLRNKLEQYGIPVDYRVKYERQLALLLDILDAIS